MGIESYDYGLWGLVAINTGVFVIFAFSFTRPRTLRDWRSLGAFSAFLVALFTEMYGFPLTIYLLSGWLGSRYPGVDLFSHGSGHIWETLLGWQGDPHGAPLHALSEVLIAVGFILLAASWRVLHRARREGSLATTGPYAIVRHPQYVGFIGIMLGFLLQWPTIPTLAMFPILVAMYVRLARREEREVATTSGDEYARYLEATPGFFPRPWRVVSRWRGSSAQDNSSDPQVGDRYLPAPEGDGGSGPVERDGEDIAARTSLKSSSVG